MKTCIRIRKFNNKTLYVKIILSREFKIRLKLFTLLLTLASWIIGCGCDYELKVSKVEINNNNADVEFKKYNNTDNSLKKMRLYGLRYLTLLLLVKRSADGLNGRIWNAPKHLFYENRIQEMINKYNIK